MCLTKLLPLDSRDNPSNVIIIHSNQPKVTTNKPTASLNANDSLHKSYVESIPITQHFSYSLNVMNSK